MYQTVRRAKVAFGREAVRNVTDLATICLEMIVRATRLHEITKKEGEKSDLPRWKGLWGAHRFLGEGRQLWPEERGEPWKPCCLNQEWQYKEKVVSHVNSGREKEVNEDQQSAHQKNHERHFLRMVRVKVQLQGGQWWVRAERLNLTIQSLTATFMNLIITTRKKHSWTFFPGGKGISWQNLADKRKTWVVNEDKVLSKS